MLEFPLWKKLTLWALTLAFALSAVPSLLATGGVELPEDTGLPEINLGLDLAGGSHLLLEVDPDDVKAKELETMEESVRAVLRRAEPRVRIGDLSTSGDQLSFILRDASEIDRARGLIEPLMQGEDFVAKWDLQVIDGQRMVLTLTDSGLDTAVDRVMDVNIEIVRRFHFKIVRSTIITASCSLSDNRRRLLDHGML